MNWIEKTFGKKKPIIAMCHMPRLPGDPGYNIKVGIEHIIKSLQHDVEILQNGGVDAILFSNEFSMPYMLNADVITVAAMARIIGALKSMIRVPFGIDYMFDTKASVDLAAVTDACFIRGVVAGTYASDFGLWNTNAGDTIRHIYSRRMDDKLGVFYSIVPQGSTELGQRNIENIITSIQFHMCPDAICIPSQIIENLFNNHQIENTFFKKKSAIIVDGGCNHSNIARLLSNTDGAIVGTAFKKDGLFENDMEEERIRNLVGITKEN